MEKPETQKLSGEGARTGTRRDRWTGEREGRNGGMKELEDREKQRQRHQKETRVERQERSTDRKLEVR